MLYGTMINKPVLIDEHEWLKRIMLLHFLFSLYAKQINYNQCLVFNQRGLQIEMI